MATADMSREEYSRQLRLQFTPKEMLNDDGSINQEYFKPKSSSVFAQWTQKENDALIKGVEKLGVGNWKEIGKEFFPGSMWSTAFLAVKFKQLIGRQDLSDLHGRHMTAEEIAAEADRCKRAIESGTVRSVGGVILAGETF